MKSRGAYFLLAVATIGIGLIVHQFGSGLNPTLRDVLGDILWAIMIFFWIGAVVPAAPLAGRAAAALATCFAVELSQLYHTPSLDAVRQTTIGQLTLGSGFDPRDLIAYSVGVLLAALLERTWKARQT